MRQLLLLTMVLALAIGPTYGNPQTDCAIVATEAVARLRRAGCDAHAYGVTVTHHGKQWRHIVTIWAPVRGGFLWLHDDTGAAPLEVRDGDGRRKLWFAMQKFCAKMKMRLDALEVEW